MSRGTDLEDTEIESRNIYRKIRGLLGGLSLSAKMVLVTVLVGIVSWSVLDYFQEKGLKGIFLDQLSERLAHEAMENRLNFDHYIKAYHKLVRLIVSQKRFHDYVATKEWSPGEAVQIKYYQRVPPWFPGISLFRTFPRPRYALLIDVDGKVREVYRARTDVLPLSLRHPARLLIDKSHRQSLITILDDKLYLVTSESLMGDGQARAATLLVASPVDDEFLIGSQSRHDMSSIIAILSEERPRVLVSSDPKELPAGAMLDELQDRYLITGREFLDYGSSELVIKFATFISKSKVEFYTQSLLSKARRQRALLALVIILSVTLIMSLITRNIRRLTQDVIDFEKRTLGIEEFEIKRGDELHVLKDRFRSLAEEVLLSHEIIKKEAEEQNRIIVNNAFDAIIATDADGMITTWNPQAETMFGIKRENARGLNLFEAIIAPEHRDTYTEGLKGFLASGEWPIPDKQIETTAVHSDGHVFPIELSISSAKSKNAYVLIAIARDITHRKLMETQLVQTGKMESIGRLAGGIAHDFNNIMSIIIGYTEIALEEIAKDEPLGKHLKIIHDAAEKAADLTRQLLAFSRKQIIKLDTLNLNNILEKMRSIIERLIGEDVKTEIINGEGLWNIKADRSQIEQIIMNMVLNARDAMPKGGDLVIETANIMLDEEYVETHFDVKGGEYVMLAVSDTGSGIPEDVKEHIFEPFFSTKEQGKSTGLGLATVYGIVKQNNGYINVYSEPGKGSVFKVYLPRAEGEIEKIKTEHTMEMPRGSETVLLVEDSGEVRKLTATILSNLGYTVLESEDAREALTLSERYHGRIDLLLTDVVMPKMSGSELAERITKKRPQVKILFMSGYTENAIVSHGVLKDGVNFLPKPIKPQNLALSVRKVLGGT